MRGEIARAGATYAEARCIADFNRDNAARGFRAVLGTNVSGVIVRNAKARGKQALPPRAGKISEVICARVDSAVL